MHYEINTVCCVGNVEIQIKISKVGLHVFVFPIHVCSLIKNRKDLLRIILCFSLTKGLHSKH